MKLKCEATQSNNASSIKRCLEYCASDRKHPLRFEIEIGCYKGMVQDKVPCVAFKKAKSLVSLEPVFGGVVKAVVAVVWASVVRISVVGMTGM